MIHWFFWVQTLFFLYIDPTIWLNVHSVWISIPKWVWTSIPNWYGWKSILFRLITRRCEVPRKRLKSNTNSVIRTSTENHPGLPGLLRHSVKLRTSRYTAPKSMRVLNRQMRSAKQLLLVVDNAGSGDAPRFQPWPSLLKIFFFIDLLSRPRHYAREVI
jgi:hypothetical protein